MNEEKDDKTMNVIKEINKLEIYDRDKLEDICDSFGIL